MDEILEPEGPNHPAFKKRAEDVYQALRKKLDSAPFGSQSLHFSKCEVEGLMGLLSHRFEGAY